MMEGHVQEFESQRSAPRVAIPPGTGKNNDQLDSLLLDQRL